MMSVMSVMSVPGDFSLTQLEPVGSTSRSSDRFFSPSLIHPPLSPQKPVFITMDQAMPNAVVGETTANLPQHLIRHREESSDSQDSDASDPIQQPSQRFGNMRCDSLVPNATKLESLFHKMYLKAVRDRDRLRTPSEYYLQPRWRRESYSGDQMLQSLFDCLARFDRVEFTPGKSGRSKEQVEMHLLWTQVPEFLA